jgi:hypothetical protein
MELDGNRAVGRALTMVALLCAIAGLVLVVADVTQDVFEHLGRRALKDRVWLLDVDSEESIYTWLSIVVLFANALAMALVASSRAVAGRRDVLHWRFLACGFAALSLDEAVSLHEKLADPMIAAFHPTGVWSVGWVVPAAIGSFAALLLVLPFLLRMPWTVARALVAAGIVFVGGAVGMEMLSGLLIGAPDQLSFEYRELSALEETLELAGSLWCLAIIGRNFTLLADY